MELLHGALHPVQSEQDNEQDVNLEKEFLSRNRKKSSNDEIILWQERQIKGEVNKMLCEKCKTQMIYVRENSVQGWTCPVCGWEILTTFIDQIHQDMTEYSICTKGITNIDQDKIKVISKISGVNYIAAKQMLEKEGICILKAKAIDIQKAIYELEKVSIPFEVTPELS